MMKTKFVSRLVAGLAGVMIAGAAMAVGDLPTRLSKQQAASLYSGIRPLLTNDGANCPQGQVPVSGQVEGGSAPGTGSQTTTIAFDKGGIVKIVRQWSRRTGSTDTASTTITCSGDGSTHRASLNEQEMNDSISAMPVPVRDVSPKR